MQLNYDRDNLISEYSLGILKERYMLPSENSPQEAFARAAKAYADDDIHAQNIYDYVSQQWMAFSTPILSNGGTGKGLPISCYLNYAADSRQGLNDHWTENTWLASMGGGIGGYWGDIRSDGEATSKGSKSTGSIPFMHVVDSQMLAVSQGTTRRGAYAAYQDISHPEIKEFINMRKPTGGDSNRKNLNLHHGINITDDFMKIIEGVTLGTISDDSWNLIDPHSGNVTETVSAKGLWEQILETRMETGEPYLHFIDTTNRMRHEAHKNLGLDIKQSNLCVAPETLVMVRHKTPKYIVEEYGPSCELIPICQLEGKEVEVWNGFEYSKVTVRKTGEDAELLKITLRKIGGSNTGSLEQIVVLECTPYHKFYLEKGREVRAGDLEKGDNLETFLDPYTKGRPSYMADAEVVSVEHTGRRDATYCFTEPLRGRGMFNGIVTGNCSEITLPTNAERTAVCCLSSVNLEHYDAWKDTNMVADLVRFLDNVLTAFIEEAPDEMHRAKYSATRERSLGLGAMGFHSYLQSKNLPFDCAMAVSLNKSMFKRIREEAELETKELAYERGRCPDIQEGCSEMRRNTYLMAVAPNASSSIICGNTSPSIEPFSTNCIMQKTLNGTNILRNKRLDLTPEQWKTVSSNRGSIFGMGIEDEDVFKTAFEIDQHWIIEHAAARAEYIDQSQSVNLFFNSGVPKSYLHSVHLSAWKKGLKTLYYLRSQASNRTDDINATQERHAYDECIACT